MIRDGLERARPPRPMRGPWLVWQENNCNSASLGRIRRARCCIGTTPSAGICRGVRGRGARATPVDGNIERVIARLFAVKKPLPAAKEEIRRLAGTLTPAKRAGDFAQALMDLGASLCTPKRPSCLMCPLQRDCSAHAQGIEGTLPIKAVRPERPVRVGLAFVALREDAHVLLRKRPEAGLLGGMLEVPSTDWADTLPPVKEALRTAPVRAEWWAVPGTVVHTFTH